MVRVALAAPSDEQKIDIWCRRHNAGDTAVRLPTPMDMEKNRDQSWHWRVWTRYCDYDA